MSEQTKIFEIFANTQIDAEGLVELFSWLDTEGIEELGNAIKVYVNKEQEPNLIPFLKEKAQELQLDFSTSILEEKDWNEEWEKSFAPVQIGQIAGIRASFHKPFQDVNYDIVINPKMSFGTGHHATTRQVIEIMSTLDLKEKKVLDCGSGTGILSILAEKMGAKTVTAVDIDKWCFENHQENNQLNHTHNKIVLGGIEDIEENNFDLVLANIQKNYLIENSTKLTQKIAPQGYLIISGFFQSDIPDILQAFEINNLSTIQSSVSENWACILLQKK